MKLSILTAAFQELILFRKQRLGELRGALDFDVDVDEPAAASTPSAPSAPAPSRMSDTTSRSGRQVWAVGLLATRRGGIPRAVTNASTRRSRILTPPMVWVS